MCSEKVGKTFAFHHAFFVFFKDEFVGQIIELEFERVNHPCKIFYKGWIRAVLFDMYHLLDVRSNKALK